MLMNRRKMLAFSMGAVAMTLTGCRRTKTTVVVRNQTGAALSVNATANVGGVAYTFNKVNIPNKRTVSQTYNTGNRRGSVNLTGTATVGAATGPFNVVVQLGKRNVYVVTRNGAGNVFINGRPA